MRSALRFRQWLLLLLLACVSVSYAQDAPPPEEKPVPPGAQRVMVPMRDGVKLSTDIYMPEGDGPFPVVLSRSVYDKNAAGGFGSLFTKKGMVQVVQELRGYHLSEGEDNVFEDDGWGKNQDGVDTVKWIREQPWCNGTIGTFGASALGITQHLLAGADDTIAAQAIWVAAGNFYGSLSYQGGVLRKHLFEEWVKAQGSEHMIALYKSHPTYDDFWALKNADARADRITAPGIHIAGWWDIFDQGVIDSFVARQYHGGEGAKGNQKLIMGAWLHGPVKEPGNLKLKDNFNYDFAKDSVRFLEHWLTGADNGIMDEPAVRYYTLGDVEDPDAPGNEWRTADDWPPFPTTETAYYFKADGGMSTALPESEDASLNYAYDPNNPVPTQGGQNLMLPAGPFDQRPLGDRPDVLVFATEPLEAPMEITGKVKVRLYVSTDAPDTDFTAKFIDVYPDGREILMLDNIQRLKFRNGFEKADPLPAGEIGEVEIDLWTISLIVNKGHRLMVHISSSNYPRFEKNPNTGADFPEEGGELRVANNTVYVNRVHPSALLLPLRHD